MEMDPSHEQHMKLKAEELQSLVTGPLQSSIAKLSGSSRGMPSDKDFHFYYNFDEFKLPVREIERRSNDMLGTIGKSSHFLGKEVDFPSKDLDDEYDWLVNVNDEVLERFDVSVDQFWNLRKREEETGKRLMNLPDSEDGFRVVYGKNSKKGVGLSRGLEGRVGKGEDPTPLSGVKVASKAGTSKPKVPFHIPTIPRPQDVYKIVVNNSNQPFTHVWLPKSDHGSRVIHPLEKLSVLDFVDKDILMEPEKPAPIDSIPFKLVEEVKDLKELAAKLRNVNELAVDLEHNQYRSFQGLTCLMQVSTRTEDYIVDTLKLRIHIGPYLREIFKDPTKKKIMHGADHDILWLQRDFGIYVCNLFDTGQASRVLKMERNSLGYLLSHFCGIVANKEYQNADWRVRPLPHEMLRYGREDTHYLLYIYDVMRHKLLSSAETEDPDALLLEVYKRSYDICMQLYEKELLTDSSYLYIYGLHGIDLNAQQLAVVSGLCEWRDGVARAEDESTGYILPNKMLIEIAKQMPFTANKLRRLVRSKHPYVERNLSSVVNIIRHSSRNAAAFEAAVEQLKERRMERASEEKTLGADGSKATLPLVASASVETICIKESIGGNNSTSNCLLGLAPASVPSSEAELGGSKTGICRSQGVVRSDHPGENGNVRSEADGHISPLASETTSGSNVSDSACKAIVQVSNKPSSAFGALLGTSAKRKQPDKQEEGIKLVQSKSSVNLSFRSFFSREEQLQQAGEEATKPVEISDDDDDYDFDDGNDKFVAMPGTGSSLEDVVQLDSESDIDESPTGDQLATDGDVACREDNGMNHDLEVDEENGNMSLSDLSSSFKKCFQSLKQKKVKQDPRSQEVEGLKQFIQFDYAAARRQVKFGEDPMVASGTLGNEYSKSRVVLGDKKKTSVVGLSQKEEGTKDNLPGKRRQAFPATGNRSATFL